MRKTIVFRVDASLQTGTGHLMRCLTLAETLIEKQASIYFIARSLSDYQRELIQQKGFSFLPLPSAMLDLTPGDIEGPPHAHWLGVSWEQDAEETLACIDRLQAPVDWLVVDSYAIDKRWEQKVSGAVQKLMVIDDLTDREHACDFLLNQNIPVSEDQYVGLVPGHCTVLQGPAYALLRKGFQEIVPGKRFSENKIRINLFFGASDRTAEIVKALQALQMLDDISTQLDVVLGKDNPHKNNVEEICNKFPSANVLEFTHDMAGLLNLADISIGAAGSTVWERMRLGIPSIVVSIAENQDDICRLGDQEGLHICLGKAEESTQEMYLEAIRKLVNDQDYREGMMRRGQEEVDGAGVKRVSAIMLDDE